MFQLQLELVRNECDKLRIRGFSFGVADGVSEKALQSIQITPIPGNLDCVADGSLHPGGGGLKCLCHLGI